MSWDKSKPTNTTKLRNIGEEIRPHWAAIESADDTFKPEGLNLDINAIDRTAIADTLVMYNKANELYSIDPASVIRKLTGGSFTANAPGKLILPNGFTLIWGTGGATTAWATKTFDTVGGVVGFANNCFHISGSANTSTETIGFQLLSKTQYKVKCSGGSPTYFYFAIGN